MNHPKAFHDAIPPLPYTFRDGSVVITVKKISHDDKMWYINDLEASYLGKPIFFPRDWFPMGWAGFTPDKKALPQIHDLVSKEVRQLWGTML